jgi:hypothetical protein
VSREERILGLGKQSRRVVGGAVLLLLAIGVVLDRQRLGNDMEYRLARLNASNAPSLAERRVRSEVAALGPRHPWAGGYGRGDGLTGEGIIVAPVAGYLFERWGDSGPWSEENTGLVEFHQGLITFPGSDDWMLKSGLVPVRWGSRRYLIRADEMEEFVDHVNSGLQPEYGRMQIFFIRAADQNSIVTGFPDLPEPARSLLRLAPLDAEIKAVGSGRVFSEKITESMTLTDRWNEVLLSAGRRQGVRIGHVFHPRGKDQDGEATVTTVNENSAVAMFRVRNASYPSPRKGWRVSTRYEFARDYSLLDPPFSINIVRSAGKPRAPISGGARDLWHRDSLAVAAATGFRVTPVARLAVSAVSQEVLNLPAVRERIGRAAAATGGNAFVWLGGKSDLAEESKGQLRRKTAQVYLVEWEGRPLEEFPTFGETAQQWEEVKPRAALARLPYTLARGKIFESAGARLLHLSLEQVQRLPDLKIEELMPEQRAAFASVWGLTDESGTIAEAKQSKEAEKAWSEVMAAETSGPLKALEAADPKGAAEHERLEKLAWKF